MRQTLYPVSLQVMENTFPKKLILNIVYVFVCFQEGSAPPSVESFSAYSLNNALMEMGRGSVALSGPIRLVCNASGSPKPR